ncbi:MAG: UPF0175 family protein [Euryarchaeota archaeon]|nr:UPF0175 family protein [Euryarchaeota archaeon]
MIVFDSSTLILLAKKELLDLFLDNFEGGVANRGCKEEGGGIGKMSIGIEGKDYILIEELSKIEGEEKSKVLKELMELGRMMFALRRYEEGKYSLGKAAEIAGMSLSEFMDLLSEFGIKSRISYEDYLEGFDNLKEVW